MEFLFLKKNKQRIFWKKIHMMNCEAAATPMNINKKFRHADGTEKLFSVSVLSYLMHTRPNNVILFVLCPD